jgi:uncharacterized YccA/Bax inhibitor family protein
MPNPVLNDKAFNKAATEGDVGWAARDAATVHHPPITDGPVSPWTRTEVMTAGGAISATGVLLVVLVATGVLGWNAVEVDAAGDVTNFPWWIFASLLVAVGLAFFTVFKPKLARFSAPLYAAAEGLVVGAISRAYEARWNGIVIMAVGVTAAVFATMLFLYRFRIIKVTDRTRKTIVMATLGIAVFYLISMVFTLFGARPSFLFDGSIMGIGLSVVIAGVAAFNLLLDFDLIERGAAAGAPKYMEWYCAFGLLVTLVWLYLEILRLLSRLQQR